jgi:hypothetical protein
MSSLSVKKFGTGASGYNSSALCAVAAAWPRGSVYTRSFIALIIIGITWFKSPTMP